MSIVSKVFDSATVPTAIHTVTDNLLEYNTNVDLLSRAASERGVIPISQAPRPIAAWWWRQGGDLHVVAVEDASSDKMCEMQKAVIRMPSECISINVVRLSETNAVCVLGVIGVTPSFEVLCSRIQVGHGTSSLYLRTLPDVFTSLKGSAFSLTAASAIAGFSIGQQFAVLAATAEGAIILMSVDDEANAAIAYISQSGPTVTAIAPIANTAHHSSFVVAHASGQLSLVSAAQRIEEPIVKVRLSASAGTPVAVCATASGSSLLIAVTSESGDCALVNIPDRTALTISTQLVVPQPTDGSAVGSLFISPSGVALVGWIGVDLWSLPTTCVSAHRRGDSSCSIVGTYTFGPAINGSQSVWITPQSGVPEPFWFIHASSDKVIMSVADPYNGTSVIYVADNSSQVGELVASQTFGFYGEEGINTQATECKSIFEVSVSPLNISDSVNTNTNPPRTKAFRVGLALLGKVPKSVQSLQYLLYRSLVCPNRFANFSEFSELRTDALIASVAECEVTEEDVRAALELIEECEETESAFYTTPTYLCHGSLQDLSARLSYLIVVFIGWIGTTTVSFATSPVTTEFSHKAEVLAAAIRSILALQTSTHQLLVASESVPTIARIVNTLSQVSLNDALQMIFVAHMLSSCGNVGAQASSHWITLLKARNPLLAHFSILASLAASGSSGSRGAIMLAEVYSVTAHLAMFPSDTALQMLAAIGIYTHYPNPEALEAEVKVLLTAHPALTPKLYKTLLLRRALTSQSSPLPPTGIECAFLPDFHIVRRYASDIGNLSCLDALMRDLSTEVALFLSRAAIDDGSYQETFRLLALANRESLTSPERASFEGIINQCVVAAVDRSLASGRWCDLCNATISDPTINELIAQRLYLLSVAQPGIGSGNVSVPHSTSRADIEAAEQLRYRNAIILFEFLTRRHAFGTSAHSMYAIAAAARTSSQATARTMPIVVKLMSLALASAKAIPAAAPPPDALVELAEEHKCMVRQPSFSIPQITLADLRPMSRLDIPLLEKRLFQSRCEYKLQRIPRNVVKSPWREDGADRIRLERLVADLLTVRLWADAFRLSQCSNLDTTLVYQAEAADLASLNYQNSIDVAAQWKAFIGRLVGASTVQNGYQPLRKALMSALAINHRHVPPQLKSELAQRDLGALLNILLHSGKKLSSGSHGKRLSLSVISEILDWGIRYVRATDASTTSIEEKEAALSRVGLWPNTFVSYPILERIEVLAQSASAMEAEDENGRRKEVSDSASTYISLVKKRNENK